MITLDTNNYFNVSDLYNPLLEELSDPNFTGLDKLIYDLTFSIRASRTLCELDVDEKVDYKSILNDKKSEQMREVSKTINAKYMGKDETLYIYYNLSDKIYEYTHKFNDSIKVSDLKISFSESSIKTGFMNKIAKFICCVIDYPELEKELKKTILRKLKNKFSSNISFNRTYTVDDIKNSEAITTMVSMTNLVELYFKGGLDKLYRKKEYFDALQSRTKLDDIIDDAYNHISKTVDLIPRYSYYENPSYERFKDLYNNGKISKESLDKAYYIYSQSEFCNRFINQNDLSEDHKKELAYSIVEETMISSEESIRRYDVTLSGFKYVYTADIYSCNSRNKYFKEAMRHYQFGFGIQGLYSFTELDSNMNHKNMLKMYIDLDENTDAINAHLHIDMIDDLFERFKDDDINKYNLYHETIRPRIIKDNKDFVYKIR